MNDSWCPGRETRSKQRRGFAGSARDLREAPGDLLMPNGARHQAIVAAVLDAHPGMQTKGFAAAMRQHFADKSAAVGRLIRRTSIVPDAFEVTPEKVTVVEVVVSNMLDDFKTNIYGDLKHALMAEGVEFGVWLVDPLGRVCPLALEPIKS